MKGKFRKVGFVTILMIVIFSYNVAALTCSDLWDSGYSNFHGAATCTVNNVCTYATCGAMSSTQCETGARSFSWAPSGCKRYTGNRCSLSDYTCSDGYINGPYCNASYQGYYLKKDAACGSSYGACSLSNEYSVATTNNMVTMFRDADGDGYGVSNINISACGSPPGYVLISGDCNDADPQINPGMTEINFTRCTNSKDDDCSLAADYLDTKCQMNCSAGYTEWLRYNDSNISKSYVMNPGITGVNKYQYYFPLCLNASVSGSSILNTNCNTPSALSVLWQNPTTKQIVSNANPDPSSNGFTNSLCLNANDCYVSSTGVCNADHAAIASLTNDENASYVGHPSNVNSNLKLCCAFNTVGVSFNNTAATPAYFPCKTISDGICPEDFEDQFGRRVSCNNYHDPDCGFASKFYYSSLFRKPKFLMNFSEKSYVLSSNNSNNSLVTIYNESDNVSARKYTYEFAITSDLHSDFSKTELVFSTGSLPNVSFDGYSVSSCSLFGVPVSAVDLINNYAPAKACYLWESDSNTLTLYHQLSDHKVDVVFSYTSIPILLIIFLIFAILVPLVLVKRSHISLKLSFKKKETPTVEQKIAQLGKAEIELEKYIQQSLATGTSRSKIYATLLNVGWDKKDIDRIFNKVKGNR